MSSSSSRPIIAWTVVSLLHAPRLLGFVQHSLRELEAATSQNESLREEEACIAAVVEKHIEWDLPDQSQASFLSPRLEEVMKEMDKAILPQQQQHQAAARGGGEHNEVNEAKRIAELQSQQQPRACLVHCALGVSRSATLCASWLLTRRKHTTLQDALECIRKAKPDIMPNMGFLAGLRALEQCQGDVQRAIQRLQDNSKKQRPNTGSSNC